MGHMKTLDVDKGKAIKCRGGMQRNDFVVIFLRFCQIKLIALMLLYVT